MSATPAIEARDVHKQFGDDGILEGVDLTVRDGEILALLGPNGVGKTVLLSCLAGSTTPAEGEIDVYGTPVSEVPGEHVSFLMQEAMAVDSLTGRENIEFYSRLHPSFTDRWRDYVERLGIADDLDKRVENYSGGMTRKLEFAITLSIDVDVYLLDEPTAGVDLSMVQQFHDCILERNEAGRTVVVTSHLPADIELADRIAFMRDGTVTETGSPEDLLGAVPSVVRVDGARAASAAESHVRDGRLFRAGAEARGFLKADRSVGDVEAAVEDGVRVTDSRPTYTDMFNYFVHMV
jgi:ABC-2 type transport system ATP-binding protein